jgi:hypothetical protein
MSTDPKSLWMRVLLSMHMALGTVLTLFVLPFCVRIHKADAAVAEGIGLQ